MNPNITSTIKYIGADDRDLDLFESQYAVPEGMCYNSYVIFDEKVCIMDTVDARCVEEWKENLRTALGDRTPDYLVVQHMEPDHTGGIVDTLAAFPSLQVVASAKAIEFMEQFNEGLDLTGRTIAVKDGSTLSLGKRTLHFITAPLVHWPEVIMTYDDGDQVMFTADAFGKFGTYDSHPDDWATEARRYYVNICGKYGPQVGKALDKVGKFDVRMICSLHGTVLSGAKMAEAVRLYRIWSRYEVETPGVVVAFASVHGGTKKAARRMAEILREKGAPEVVLHDLARGSIDHAVADAFRYGTLIVAASSYDADVFPPDALLPPQTRTEGLSQSPRGHYRKCFMGGNSGSHHEGTDGKVEGHRTARTHRDGEERAPHHRRAGARSTGRRGFGLNHSFSPSSLTAGRAPVRNLPTNRTIPNTAGAHSRERMSACCRFTRRKANAAFHALRFKAWS